MALKSGNTSYRHQIVSQKRHERQGVGDTYKSRHEYETERLKNEATSASFLGKIRDFFLGPKLPNVHEFASNASFVNGAKTITQYHKELEQGVRSGAASTDEDLLAILNHVEKASR